MLLNRILKIGFPLLSLACYSQGQQSIDSLKQEHLDEVVVTATRTKRLIATLPLPTHIISAATIEKAGVTRLDEILAQQTGLHLTSDFGGVEGLQMQGLDAAYILILMDGVPLVGRSAGTFDLSRISVGNIDRIEIVKGASSSLYGSEALAGVINIITKKPTRNNTSGNGSFRYASWNTNDVNLNLNWKKEKISATLFTNYFSSNGYDLDPKTELKTVEPYRNTTIQPRVFWDFSKNVKFTFGTRFYNQLQEYKTIINAINYAGNATILEWDLHSKLEQKWGANVQVDYELYATNYKNNSFLNGPENILFEQNYYNQWLYRPEVRALFNWRKNKIIAGAGFNHESLDRTYFATKVAVQSQYIFSQLDFNPTDRVNFLLGIRYDNNSQFASQWSPKFAVNYKVNPSLSFKTSIGYGFKAPDFRQLYFDFTNSSVGYTVLGYNVAESQLNVLEKQGQLLNRILGISFENPLEPESSVNLNLGSFYQKEKLKVETNFFYNSISKLIDTRVAAQKNNGQNVFSYFNVDQIFTYGLEFNSTYTYSKQFNVSIGYQYLIAKDESVVKAVEKGTVYARDPVTLESFQIKKSDYFGLFNRSKNMANLKFYFAMPKIKTDFNLQVFYKSKYGLWDSNNNQVLDKYDDFVNAFTTINISASKKILKKFTIQAGVNNLFDFTNPQEISTLSGRLFFTRLQFNF